MLALYLALGILGADDGAPIAAPISLPAARMVTPVLVPTASKARGLSTGYAYVADAPFDPADRTPYGMDCSTLLGSEGLGAIEAIGPDAAAVTAGVTIEDTGERRPIIDIANKRIAFWPKVAEASQHADAFKAAGIDVGVTIRFRSSSTPPKILERTMAITVRQL